MDDESRNSASKEYQRGMTSDEFRAKAVEDGLLTTDWRQKLGNPSVSGMDMYMEYLKTGNLKMTNPKWGDESGLSVVDSTLNDCAWGVFRDWAEYSSWLAAAMKMSRKKIKTNSMKGVIDGILD